MTAEKEFQKQIDKLAESHEGIAGQMFGRRCIKVGDNVAVAVFQGYQDAGRRVQACCRSRGQRGTQL